MLKGTPSIKVLNAKQLGANVLHGSDVDEAKAECARLMALHNLRFVPPYDDPFVMRGKAPSAWKSSSSCPTLRIFQCCRRWWASGRHFRVRENASASPDTMVYGVETVDGDTVYQSLKKGGRVTLPEVGPLADGTAVHVIGQEQFRIYQTHLDEVIIVSNDEFCARGHFRR